MNNSFGIEPCISRRTSCKKDMIVRSFVYVTGALAAAMELMADPPAGGGDQADLVAGTPFKTTRWAGYEKHRQYH
jgi:hypothetical protein